MLRKRYLLTASIVLALLSNVSIVLPVFAAVSSTTIVDAAANNPSCTTGDCSGTVYVNAGGNQSNSCTGAVCHTYQCQSDGSLTLDGVLYFKGVYPTCVTVLNSNLKKRLEVSLQARGDPSTTCLSNNSCKTVVGIDDCLEYYKVWRFYGTVSYDRNNPGAASNPKISSVTVSKATPPGECENQSWFGSANNPLVLYYPNPGDSSNLSVTTPSVWNQVSLDGYLPHDISTKINSVGGDDCTPEGEGLLLSGVCKLATSPVISKFNTANCADLMNSDRISTANLSDKSKVKTVTGEEIPLGNIIKGFQLSILLQKSISNNNYNPDYKLLSAKIKNDSSSKSLSLLDSTKLTNLLNSQSAYTSSSWLPEITQVDNTYSCSSVLDFIAGVKEVPLKDINLPQSTTFTATCAIPVKSNAQKITDSSGNKAAHGVYADNMPNGNVIGKKYYSTDTIWNQDGSSTINFGPIGDVAYLTDGTKTTASGNGKFYATYLTNLIKNSYSYSEDNVIAQIDPSNAAIASKQIYAYYETPAAKAIASANPFNSKVLNNIYCSEQVIVPALVYRVIDPEKTINNECLVTSGALGTTCCESTLSNPTPCPTVTPTPTPTPTTTPTSGKNDTDCIGSCGRVQPSTPYVNIYLTTVKSGTVDPGSIASGLSLVTKFNAAGTISKQKVTLVAQPTISCSTTCAKSVAAGIIPSNITSLQDYSLSSASMVALPGSFKAALASEVVGDQSYNKCEGLTSPKCSYIANNNGLSGNPTITYQFNSATNKETTIYTGVSKASIGTQVSANYTYTVNVTRVSISYSTDAKTGKVTTIRTPYTVKVPMSGSLSLPYTVDQFFTPGNQSVPVLGSVTGR